MSQQEVAFSSWKRGDRRKTEEFEENYIFVFSKSSKIKCKYSNQGFRFQVLAPTIRNRHSTTALPHGETPTPEPDAQDEANDFGINSDELGSIRNWIHRSWCDRTRIGNFLM